MSSFVRCVGLLLSIFVFAGCQPASIETLLNEAEEKGLAKIVRKQGAPWLIEVDALEDLDPRIIEAISSKKYLIRVTGGETDLSERNSDCEWLPLDHQSQWHHSRTKWLHQCGRYDLVNGPAVINPQYEP